MTTQEIALAPCVVLSDSAGKFVGVAAAEVMLRRLEEILVDLMSQYSGTRQYIMEKRGHHALVAASVEGVSISSNGSQVALLRPSRCMNCFLSFNSEGCL